MCSSQSNSTRQDKNQQNMIHDQENTRSRGAHRHGKEAKCHRDQPRLNSSDSSAFTVHREPGSGDERNGAQENNKGNTHR